MESARKKRLLTLMHKKHFATLVLLFVCISFHCFSANNLIAISAVFLTIKNDFLFDLLLHFTTFLLSGVI